MKTIHSFTILLLFFLVTETYAQSYTLTTSKGLYTDLVGSTSLNNGDTWDDPSFSIDFGFDFLYFDELIDSGSFELGLGSFIYAAPDVNGNAKIFIPFGPDVIDRGYDFVGSSDSSQSNISYLLDGEPGSRILKIEWNNVGFYEELSTDNISNDFVNFQIWLYEENDVIEYRFGPNEINFPIQSYSGESGAFLGLVGGYDVSADTLIGTTYLLGGDPSAPTLVPITSQLEIVYLDGDIPNGTIYRFENLSTKIQDIPEELSDLKINPNLIVDEFNVDYDASKVKIESLSISNTSGCIVKSFAFSNNTISIADLSAGIYFINFKTDIGTITKKIIKQ